MLEGVFFSKKFTLTTPSKNGFCPLIPIFGTFFEIFINKKIQELEMVLGFCVTPKVWFCKVNLILHCGNFF